MLIGLAISMAATAATVQAQSNFAVRRLADDARHEFHSVPGCPGQWPVAVDRLAPGATNPWPDRVTLTEAQLANVYRVVGPSFTNWHAGAWATAQRAKASNETAQVRAQEEALRAAFQDAENEWSTVNTNAPTASELLRLVRRQNELLMRMRPKVSAEERLQQMQSLKAKIQQEAAEVVKKKKKRAVAPKTKN